MHTGSVSSAALEFPSTYASLATERLRDAYEAAPGRLGRALEGLAEDEVRARPVPGKWSIHEIVFHLCDSERIGSVRFRQAIGSERPVFPGYDQDRWADRLAYSSRTAHLRAATLRIFAMEREVTGDLLASLTPEEWKRRGSHPEWGSLHVRQLLELYADHGERHLDQILDRRRRLGRPLALSPLLPDRLF